MNIKNLLKRVWERWKKIAHVIGVFNTKLVLNIFYYTLLLPFAMLVRLFMDPLTLRMKNTDSNWVPRKSLYQTLEEFRKQS